MSSNLYTVSSKWNSVSRCWKPDASWQNVNPATEEVPGNPIDAERAKSSRSQWYLPHPSATFSLWSRADSCASYTTNDQSVSAKCLVTGRCESYGLQEGPGELRNMCDDRACRDERDRHVELLARHLMRSEVGYSANRTEHY